MSTNNANGTSNRAESSDTLGVQQNLQQPQIIQTQQQPHQLIGELNSNIILLRGPGGKQQKSGGRVGGDQILLQTLKRIDRTTPILLLRNNSRVDTGQKFAVATTRKQNVQIKDEDNVVLAQQDHEENDGVKHIMPIGTGRRFFYINVEGLTITEVLFWIVWECISSRIKLSRIFYCSSVKAFIIGLYGFEFNLVIFFSRFSLWNLLGVISKINSI